MLEFPAGTVSDGEQAEAAALLELEEETGYAHTHADGAARRPMGAWDHHPPALETVALITVWLAL